jgi:hypothetical protein
VGDAASPLHTQRALREITDGEATSRKLQTSQQDISCADRKWHLSLTDGKSCTNDLEYPDKWNMDVYLGVMLFITSDKCCDFVLGSGYDDCTVSDDCTPESIPISNKEHTSCSKWYPSTIESNTCTNNKDDIPPEWSDASYNYLFSSTSEECCQLMFAGKACNVKSCEGHTQLGDSFQVVTGSPTEQPSSKVRPT